MTKKEELSKKIAEALFKKSDFMTCSEIANEIAYEPSLTFNLLKPMAENGLVEKIEKSYVITDYAILLYGFKQDASVIVKESKPKTKGKPMSELKSIKLKPAEVVESVEVVEAVVESIETVAEMPVESTEMLFEKHTQNFKVWQIVDALGAKVIELLAETKPKEFDNIEYKLATLESLAEIYNPKIGATLREIAADLKG